MAGLDESLGRGMKALEITHRQLTEAAPQELRQSLDDQFRSLPWWRRWMFRAWHARAQEHVAAAMAHVTRAGIDAADGRLSADSEPHRAGTA